MKIKSIRTYVCLLAIVLSAALLLSGCGNTSTMPFNGDMTFHSISIHIDDRFIRDSTQSTDDMWIFERGGYKEYVILSRKNAAEDPSSYLPVYAESMEGVGAETKIAEFWGSDAVFSTYEKDGIYCQEVLFPHNGSYYAIALRGGTEEGFAELIGTVTLIENSNTREL
jgi:hypothetical protein